MSEEELLILQVSNGNLGAETFAREAIELDHDAAVKGLRRLLDWDIPGEYFYALWNDCCKRDTKLAIEVMNNFSKTRIFEALDFFNHDRAKLKDIKKLKMQQLKIEKKKKLIMTVKKINIVISITAFIIAISNFYFMSENLRLIVWGICFSILAISVLNLINENVEILRETRLLKEESLALERVFEQLNIIIEQDLIDNKSKKIVKNIVENGYEDIRLWRDIKWLRFAKKW